MPGGSDSALRRRYSESVPMVRKVTWHTFDPPKSGPGIQGTVMSVQAFEWGERALVPSGTLETGVPPLAKQASGADCAEMCPAMYGRTERGIARCNSVEATADAVQGPAVVLGVIGHQGELEFHRSAVLRM
jgi:hypothetical protein